MQLLAPGKQGFFRAALAKLVDDTKRDGHPQDHGTHRCRKNKTHNAEHDKASQNFVIHLPVDAAEKAPLHCVALFLQPVQQLLIRRLRLALPAQRRVVRRVNLFRVAVRLRQGGELRAGALVVLRVVFLAFGLFLPFPDGKAIAAVAADPEFLRSRPAAACTAEQPSGPSRR